MSTRCNIVVHDGEQAIQLYRHSDGYPTTKGNYYGVVHDLKKVFPFAWKLPRFEPDDFAAAIVAAWKKGPGGIYIDGETSVSNIEDKFHGDIAYWYAVRKNENGGGVIVEVHHCSSGRQAAIVLDENTRDADIYESLAWVEGESV